MATIAQALAAAERALSRHEAPALESQVLLAHVLKRPRSFLLAWPERPLEAAEQRRFETLVTARAAGRPVAYLTGEREFWSLPLAVNEATLIPRPETELLVERALLRMDARQGTAADLGTGCGAIALALASERRGWRVVASERSAAALEVARANARRLALDNVELRLGEWCAALGEEPMEVIVSNPPYVRVGDPHLREGDLPFEPRSALVAGEDGLEALRHIADCARAHLRPGGWLLLEHGADQGPAVVGILRSLGYQAVAGYRDLADNPRVAEGRRGR